MIFFKEKIFLSYGMECAGEDGLTEKTIMDEMTSMIEDCHKAVDFEESYQRLKAGYKSMKNVLDSVEQAAKRANAATIKAFEKAVALSDECFRKIGKPFIAPRAEEYSIESKRLFCEEVSETFPSYRR